MADTTALSPYQQSYLPQKLPTPAPHPDDLMTIQNGPNRQTVNAYTGLEMPQAPAQTVAAPPAQGLQMMMNGGELQSPMASGPMQPLTMGGGASPVMAGGAPAGAPGGGSPGGFEQYFNKNRGDAMGTGLDEARTRLLGEYLGLNKAQNDSGRLQLDKYMGMGNLEVLQHNQTLNEAKAAWEQGGGADKQLVGGLMAAGHTPEKSLEITGTVNRGLASRATVQPGQGFNVNPKTYVNPGAYNQGGMATQQMPVAPAAVATGQAPGGDAGGNTQPPAKKPGAYQPLAHETIAENQLGLNMTPGQKAASALAGMNGIEADIDALNQHMPGGVAANPEGVKAYLLQKYGQKGVDEATHQSGAGRLAERFATGVKTLIPGVKSEPTDNAQKRSKIRNLFMNGNQPQAAPALPAQTNPTFADSSPASGYRSGKSFMQWLFQR